MCCGNTMDENMQEGHIWPEIMVQITRSFSRNNIREKTILQTIKKHHIMRKITHKNKQQSYFISVDRVQLPKHANLPRLCVILLLGPHIRSFDFPLQLSRTQVGLQCFSRSSLHQNSPYRRFSVRNPCFLSYCFRLPCIPSSASNLAAHGSLSWPPLVRDRLINAGAVVLCLSWQ